METEILNKQFAFEKAEIDRKDSQNSEDNRRDVKEISETSLDSSSNVQHMPLTVPFYSGNPTVEITEGVLRLYKDNHYALKTSQTADPLRVSELDSNNNSLNSNDSSSLLPPLRSVLTLVLGVPSYLTPSDFINFIGVHIKGLSNMRVIRDSSDTKYMMIIKFLDQWAADQFYLEYHGKPFHSMEIEVCMIVFVHSVEFLNETNESASSLFPLPSGSLSELPTCPVCLERLDESTSGILTILCNHSFHCQCLAKWKGDNSCPVCRYCQQPEGQAPICAVCHTTESLWICLICGHIGCGRYLNEHARQHFKETMHQYALELQTSRVWDYAGDVYVHRLVQNETGGKLVQVNGENVNDNENIFPVSKIESISLEYSYLMEQQRRYFEQQLQKVKKECDTKVSSLEGSFGLLLETKEHQIKTILEEKKKYEKKLQKTEKKLKELVKEIEFLKEINTALKVNQTEWKDKIVETEKRLEEEKNKTIQELQNQIKDLMFHIDSIQKISNNDELQEGNILVSMTDDSNRHQNNPSNASLVGTSKRKSKKKQNK